MLVAVAERLQEPDCKAGFVLQGFPKTYAQAVALDSLLATGFDLDAARSKSHIAAAGGHVKSDLEPEEKVSRVICLEVPDALLVKRVAGRWVHAPSGRTYHVSSSPPKSLALLAAAASAITAAATDGQGKGGGEPVGGEEGNMFDDDTGEVLVQWEDDTPEASAERLAAYHEQMAPIISHYEKTTAEGAFLRVIGEQPPEVVWDQVSKGTLDP